AVPAPARAPERPTWIDPPRPDTSALRRARASAVTRLVWRLALTAVVAFAVLRFQGDLDRELEGTEDATRDVVTAALVVVGLVAVVGLVRAVARLRRAGREVRDFEEPYERLLVAERARHAEAVAAWDAARSGPAAGVEPPAGEARTTRGPLWYPVGPLADPTRIDVLGGDHRRHGWASLLVTVGTGALAAGQRLHVVDLTGQDVGGGLVRVAEAGRRSVHQVDLPADGARVDLVGRLDPEVLADVLADALADRADNADARHERALVAEVVGRVRGCLDAPVTWARLAAGVQVLRQVEAGEGLTPAEVARLADQVGRVGRDEWTARHLRILANRLTGLAGLAPGGGDELWPDGADVTVVATVGPRDERRELLDRVVVHLAERTLLAGPDPADQLVVAGADHLGAVALTRLSDRARTAGTRLLLMIDHPQGDLERLAGTGGAVCVMRMYNHRDAAVAADFIGREHRFVVSQVTRQVGRSFTDGGGDNFSANTGATTSAKPGLLRAVGRTTQLSDSRGHAWTGVRSWSATENVGDGWTASRVHELVVEPQEVLALPETAFVLVDSSGPGRRVVLADANPGITLLECVADRPRRQG
ncbi:MAG: hypothetical protein AB7L84_08555, partial [Acidimicrobiia bacterium]